MEVDEPGSAIILDANLLLWAHHRHFPNHAPARDWLTQTLTTVPSVGIPWPTTLAFVRISTHPGALERPLTARVALEVVDGWLDRSNVTTPVPADRHRDLFKRTVMQGKASGNHITDAHLAGLAVEWGLTLVSADRDFARYPELRWHDPSSAWS